MHCLIAGQDLLLRNRIWSTKAKQWLPANGCAHAALFQKDTLGLVCFNLFFFFNFIFFKLYNIVLILPNIKRNPPQVYPCSPSWTLLPPHTLPLGRPSVPAPSILYRASNLDWWLISYMIFYMFQCHSPKSSLAKKFWDILLRRAEEKKDFL